MCMLLMGCGSAGGAATPLLLDTVTGAVAAYSIRKLRTEYSGSAIRVRRSSDNAEQDIGFVSGVLDTASLLTFCGAGNGFVATWYDQSGNSYNAVNATAAAQPQIVASGAVVTVNSKTAIDFDGADDRLITSGNIGISGNPALTAMLVYRLDTVSDVLFATGNGGGTNSAFGYWLEGGIYFWGFGGGQGLDVSAPSINTQYLETYFKSPGTHSGNSSAYRNGSSVGTTADASIPNITDAPLTIGNWAGSTLYPYNGKMQELILFTTNHSAVRTSIESNINTYYSIY